MYLDVLSIERLKGSVLALVEMNQEGHEFAVAQLARSVSMRSAVAEALAGRFKVALLAEIIDMAEQFQ
jgi:hypothetical protein